MAASEELDIHDRERSSWVKLRTLVILRWIAIIGQMGTLIVAQQLFRLHLEVGLAAATIGASIVANLFFSFLYPETKRLSESEAFLMLLFDLLQLGLLLYLTGGLNNPFAVLVLAPVTIAATFLQMRNTAILGFLAVGIISALGMWYIPLEGADGLVLALPLIFLFGSWAALTIGVVFLAVYARQITSEVNDMSEALLATQMALAREQKLTDLGGVIAAAAHELGTPLATIKLVSKELLDEVEDRPEVYEDIALIAEQADRCRDIMRSMGQAGKDDLHMRRAPLQAILEEAASPHMQRGKEISFSVNANTEHPQRQPIFFRRPEIIHGLRNLVQNAVDFAATEVKIESTWDETTVRLRISDDGPGYPTTIIGRIGDPFVRRRKETENRPGYEGMGLGLFIAKTLLERSGAKLDFANEEVGGAIVMVQWPRDIVDPERGKREALGENLPILP
ncbi:ActS/PrrB/RegB family redox-sensitive histidine kinase [Marivivens donghaensis]|uniref:histidine kinase n=1 Tax=Marivivens donghaensis TaxID=1699413 RepID=A0ABX0VTW5_9RHOB|nr:ActS/PrrB/RegB family redox-sensitive histidine kinase [Marivivens donghaensis]NIY71420.1 ActS/PrrB/RegB family redox-sensitive histidine kinase [Marivivens donghaensis]